MHVQLPAGHHARGGERAGEGVERRPQPRRRRVGAQTGRAWPCPTEADLAAIVEAVSAAAVTAYVDTAPDAALMAESAGARLDHRGDRPSPRPASPSGRCRTARASCCIRRRSSRTRCSSGPSAPAARRWRPTRTTWRPRPPRRSCRRAASAASMPSPSTRCWPARWPRCCRSSRSRSRGWPAAGRPATSRRFCSSCYLRFTKPRADATAFGVMLDQAEVAGRESALDARDDVRGHGVGDALAEPLQEAAAVGRGRLGDEPREVVSRSTRTGSPTPATSCSCSRAASTSPPSGPLVTRYLASLPSTGRKESWKDTGITTAARRGGEARREGDRAPEPGARGLLRPVQVGPHRARRCSACWV